MWGKEEKHIACKSRITVSKLRKRQKRGEMVKSHEGVWEGAFTPCLVVMIFPHMLCLKRCKPSHFLNLTPHILFILMGFWSIGQIRFYIKVFLKVFETPP